MMKNKKLIMESGGVKQIKRRYKYYKKMKLSETWGIRGESMPSKASDIPKIAWSFQNRLAACEGARNVLNDACANE